jgi:S1-C subfamily serine protease
MPGTNRVRKEQMQPHSASYLPGLLPQVQNSIVIIESLGRPDSREQCYTRQGTGFYIKDVGIVTSFHNVTLKNEFYFCHNTEFKTDCKLIAHDKKRDIAILSPSTTSFLKPLSVERVFTNIAIGEKISILGFPAFARGNSMTIQNGEIIAKRRFEAQASPHLPFYE